MKITLNGQKNVQFFLKKISGGKKHCLEKKKGGSFAAPLSTYYLMNSTSNRCVFFCFLFRFV